MARKSKLPIRMIVIISIVGIAGLVGGMFLVPIVNALPNLSPFEEGLEIPFVTPEEQQTLDDLQNQIDDIIDNDDPILPDQEEDLQDITDKIDEILPPDTNQTQTSEDDPLTQIGDENPDSVFPESQTLAFLLDVTKIDSEGTITQTRTTTELQPLAFLVQEDTDQDFRTGVLEFTPFLMGEPQIRYMGTATFDLQVGQQSIPIDPIVININGITDTEGILPILFTIPTGGTTNQFSFDFNDNFNKFVNEAVTPLSVKLIQVDITDQNANKFSLIEKEIFRMDIARDDFKVVIVNEDLTTERVYAKDSRLIINGKSSPVIAVSCTIGSSTTSGAFGTFFFAGATVSPANCFTEPRSYVWKTSDGGAKVLGINLFDVNGNFILNKAGGTGIVLDELMTRNTNYTLTTSQPDVSVFLTYPKAQQTQSYTCVNDIRVNYVAVRSEGFQFLVVSMKPISFDVLKVDCNFP